MIDSQEKSRRPPLLRGRGLSKAYNIALRRSIASRLRFHVPACAPRDDRIRCPAARGPGFARAYNLTIRRRKFFRHCPDDITPYPHHATPAPASLPPAPERPHRAVICVCLTGTRRPHHNSMQITISRCLKSFCEIHGIRVSSHAQCTLPYSAGIRVCFKMRVSDTNPAIAERSD